MKAGEAMEPKAVDAVQAGLVPHGWDGWAAFVVILTGVLGAYWWWRDRIYQKGY